MAGRFLHLTQSIQIISFPVLRILQKRIIRGEKWVKIAARKRRIVDERQISVCDDHHGPQQAQEDVYKRQLYYYTIISHKMQFKQKDAILRTNPLLTKHLKTAYNI